MLLFAAGALAGREWPCAFQVPPLSIPRLCLLFLAGCFSSFALANVPALSDADVQRLSLENPWLQLVHYRPTYGRLRSEIDEPSFFLHADGKRDPAAELRATLDQLRDDIRAHPDEKQDLRCRYPARVDWLKRRLALDIPERDCPALTEWQRLVDAGSLSLIFPAAYLNNASSMFGHTLLRIDAKDRSRQPDLAASAINFAAQVEEGDGGAAYALKGFFGLYPGYFSLMPYYEKVKEYNELESRDIWEYPINFNSTELQRVVWHLWELDRVRLDYWFFDENCSYQLLALLSVGRDELDLTRGFSLKALPVDTVRALERAGLLSDDGHYRASFATRLENMVRQLSSEEIALARQLVHDGVAPEALTLPASANAAHVYEFAFEWLNSRFMNERLPREQAAPQLYRLLKARSHSGKSSLVAPAAPAVPAHRGHDSARWGLGGGVREGEAFLSLQGRASYHDRFDAVEGFLANAEIRLLDLELRVFEDRQKVEPWRFTLLDVGNYLPSSPVFSLAAWRVTAQAERTDTTLSFPDSWRSRLAGSYGRAFGSGERLMGWTFLNGELESGPQAGGEQADREWAAGAGVNVGVLWAPVQPLRLGVDARWLRFFEGDRGEAGHVEATAQWNYTSNQALRFYSRWDKRNDTRGETGLTWLHHF